MDTSAMVATASATNPDARARKSAFGAAQGGSALAANLAAGMKRNTASVCGALNLLQFAAENQPAAPLSPLSHQQPPELRFRQQGQEPRPLPHTFNATQDLREVKSSTTETYDGPAKPVGGSNAAADECQTQGTGAYLRAAVHIEGRKEDVASLSWTTAPNASSVYTSGGISKPPASRAESLGTQAAPKFPPSCEASNGISIVPGDSRKAEPPGLLELREAQQGFQHGVVLSGVSSRAHASSAGMGGFPIRFPSVVSSIQAGHYGPSSRMNGNVMSQVYAPYQTQQVRQVQQYHQKRLEAQQHRFEPAASNLAGGGVNANSFLQTSSSAVDAYRPISQAATFRVEPPLRQSETAAYGYLASNMHRPDVVSSLVPGQLGSIPIVYGGDRLEDSAIRTMGTYPGCSPLAGSGLAQTPLFGAAESESARESIPKVKGPWKAEEDRLLMDLVRKHGPKNWPTIAAQIPGRTGKQARERWLNHLNPDLTRRPWTAEEDLAIMEAHAKLGNRWSEIAKILDGRTDNAVKNRFNTTIRRQMSERWGSSGEMDLHVTADGQGLA
ncbi:Transcriptional activator Myb [Porphyridium purpureum]|uniref:Transcriptional activator Myb n=1 Tax=Porphyridium purpureum TaxID=35688 RepID=A0A5J4YPN6_PORPP|nr:Transcriptional activator Myb [Porphyridium purpureum]|eukprot:POR6371..scf222_8